MKTGILMVSAVCVAGLCRAGSVDARDGDGSKKWESFPTQMVKPAKTPDEVSPYGGHAKAKGKPTGFFRTVETSGRWWLVDPDGHLFIMKGVNSVSAENAGRSDSKRWAEETSELLRGAGFNTIGRWSQPEAFQEADVPIAWCSTTSFIKSYAKRRPAHNGSAKLDDQQTIPVFDKEWPAFCERYAEKEIAPLKEDPWLIGHFSDNELPFRPDALNNYLELPEEDAGYLAAVEWMEANGYDRSDRHDAEVQAAFQERVARRYFEPVAAAIKKADPNHLYIGSRLHGRNICEPVLRAAGACDVISINYYHRWEPEEERMENWEEWSGRPFFVSEFYAGKLASETTRPKGAGFWVLNHEDAVEFYHTHTAILLEDVPSCVGWHWFKYADETPEFQKGIVSDQGEVHQTLIDGMKIINEQAYELRGLR
jgi:hypothetical protein